MAIFQKAEGALPSAFGSSIHLGRGTWTNNRRCKGRAQEFFGSGATFKNECTCKFCGTFTDTHASCRGGMLERWMLERKKAIVVVVVVVVVDVAVVVVVVVMVVLVLVLVLVVVVVVVVVVVGVVVAVAVVVAVGAVVVAAAPPPPPTTTTPKTPQTQTTPTTPTIPTTPTTSFTALHQTLHLFPCMLHVSFCDLLRAKQTFKSFVGVTSAQHGCKW